MGVTSDTGDNPLATHLTIVGRTYYIRRIVPHDLRSWFRTDTGKPRAEFKLSLNTKDRAEAMERLHIESVRIDQLFKEARAARERGELPPHLVQALAKPPSRPSGKWAPYPTLEALEHEEEGSRLSAQEDFERENDPIEQQIAERLEAARQRWEQGQLDALKMLAEDRAIAKREGPKGTRLAVLIDRYAKANRPSQKRIDAMVAIGQWFEKYVGRRTVEEITRADVLAFKTKLLENTSDANAQTKLRNFNTLMRFAKKEAHLIAVNPAEDISVPVKRTPGTRRRGFDLPALRSIFSSPIYTDDARPEAGSGEAAYWLPLMGLYTGARLNEIGQLRPQDIFEEPYFGEDGTEASAWVFRFTADGDAQLKLKNEGSERRIPVHPVLIELGFLDYVKSVSGEARIFPELRGDKYGHITANWSKWFNRYLRDPIGVTDARMVFHSFRHAFKTYARAAKIGKDINDAITGHLPFDTGGEYGDHPLEELVPAMQAYRVPGLELPARWHQPARAMSAEPGH